MLEVANSLTVNTLSTTIFELRAHSSSKIKAAVVLRLNPGPQLIATSKFL
jgi:hypothetical protein